VNLQKNLKNVRFEKKVKYMVKALDRELFQYILQLDEAEKKSVLQMLKTFLKGREIKAPRVSIEQYNKELEEADAAMDRGEYYTNEEVFEISKKMIDARKKS